MLSSTKSFNLILKIIFSAKYVRLLSSFIVTYTPFKFIWLSSAALYLVQINLIAGDLTRCRRLIVLLQQSSDYTFIIRLASILTDFGFYTWGQDILKERAIYERDKVNDLQLNKLNLRIFSSRWFSPIGHSALIDIFIKAGQLGVIKNSVNLVVGKSSSFSNFAIIRLWNPYVRNIEDLFQQAGVDLLCFLEEKLQLIEIRDGRFIPLYALCSSVQLQWEKNDNPALLNLSIDDKNRGQKVLRELGVPVGSWFCGLHNRSKLNNTSSARNADLSSYERAIDAISACGGYVLYIGDEAPDPNWSIKYNFINYFESINRSDWMDIFLIAEGRFFIGMGSGPAAVPLCFGRPTVLVNWAPMAARHCSRNDILLPKQYRLKSESRFLTMSERMSSQFGHQDSLDSLAFMGVEVIDNSPEEIADSVIEMINIIPDSMKSTLDLSEKAAQEKFSDESLSLGLYPVRLAQTFIKRYPECFK